MKLTTGTANQHPSWFPAITHQPIYSISWQGVFKPINRSTATIPLTSQSFSSVGIQEAAR